MTLLAIDPGRDTGWALFNGGRLFSCGCSDPRGVIGCKESVVLERPQIYPHGSGKGEDPNDLITLAIQVGRYAQYYESQGAVVKMFLPREWKAQVPKGICAARILAKLDPNEQQAVHTYGKLISAGLQHNMMDAIGIGLFALGRAKVGMI